MKRYIGRAPRQLKSAEGGTRAHWYQVCVQDGKRTRHLDPRLDLFNHSPAGFAWGYHGSGPAQLALAILADVAGREIALRHYQDYKGAVIARLDQNADFTITEAEVRSWLDARAAGEADGPLPVDAARARIEEKTDANEPA
jgi:hypothetical protein